MFPQARETKEKVNYWDYNKMKSFLQRNKNINKTKRKANEWEKIFANITSDKGLIYKIDKEFIQFDTLFPK